MIDLRYPYDCILDNLHDGLYITDQNRVITYWNKAAEKMTGYLAEEVVGRSCADNILTHIDKDGHMLCQGQCPLSATICDGQARENEIYLHHKDGHRIPVSVRVSQLKDKDGHVVGGVELFTDISNQQANTLRVKELERMALLDHLTQMANRNFLNNELESRLDDFVHRQVSFGLLFIDIDHFKKFNDTYGHELGDKVLQFIAKSLTANARPFDVYGRWGGEEFIGIIRNIPETVLTAIGQRMVMLVENAYLKIDENMLKVTISMGGTMVRPGDTIDTLIQRADALLYQSKSKGRNQLTVG